MTQQNSTANESHNYWVPHPVVIQDIRHELPGVCTYDLAFVDAASASRYSFQPGQFNMLYVPGTGEVPISLSADPGSRQTWAHTIRVAGNTTRAIKQLGRGAMIGLRGPYGTAWPLDRCAGSDVLLIAGGIGLAPLRPVIYHLLSHRQNYGNLTLLYGARSPDTMLYANEFATWTGRGLTIETTVDRSAPDWLGNVGVVPLLLTRLQTLRSEQTVIMICGPEVMMRFTVQAARDRGLSNKQVWVSLERNMQCAVGMCGHCQLGPAFICRDGPVFRYDVVAPFVAVEGL